MSLLQIAYPVALAGTNMLLGWLLYHRSKPVFGALFVMLGLLVVLALVGGTVSDQRPLLSNSI